MRITSSIAIVGLGFLFSPIFGFTSQRCFTHFELERKVSNSMVTPLVTSWKGHERSYNHPVTFGASTTSLNAAELDTKEEENSQEENKIVVNNEEKDEVEEDDDDDEYELVEYENLTVADFIKSEWKVGTNWNHKKDKVDVTWVRLIIDEKDSTNVAIWGDGAKGKWQLDESAQFISVSKETFGGWGGKKIWAGPMEDYYYMQGTVRGWNPIRSASVLGLWQMIRLGVDEEERGTAPWADEDETDQSS